MYNPRVFAAELIETKVKLSQSLFRLIMVRLFYITLSLKYASKTELVS